MSESSRNFEALVEDYATEPVPDGLSVSGLRIAMINVALAFSLPGLVTGVEIGVAKGLEHSLIAFLLGGLIITVVAVLTGIIGIRNRLSSYMILRYPFGLQGSKLINLCLSLSMFGWFGVNVYLFSQAADGLWQSLFDSQLPEWMFIIMGGSLMTMAALFGFKSLQKISVFVVPVQLLIIVQLLNAVVADTSFMQLFTVPAAQDISMGEAISAVVGSFIVGAVVMPDLTRYGSHWRDAVTASFLPFFIVASFVYLVAAVTALATQQQDVLALMLAVGLGVMAFVLVIFSSLITNAINLYGCSLSFTAIFPKLDEWKVVLGSGVIGTLIAHLGIFEHFIDFIFSLGVIFTPIASIYVIDYFVIHKGYYDLSRLHEKTGVSYLAITAWLCGVVTGYAANNEVIKLTQIPSCDALLVSAVVYVLLHKLSLKPNAAVY